MRIDTAYLSEQGVLKVRTGTDSFISSLNEGDGVKAEVLSGDKGAVVMRTESGQIFRARLDPGVSLSQGDVVSLEVTGKEARIVSLAIREELVAREDSGLSELVRNFEDETLLPYASKLAQMNLPVTEESSRLMRDVLAHNQSISLDEAAFLASNKLTGDDSLLNAALSMLSGGDKTDAMLTRLIESLRQTGGETGALDSESEIIDTAEKEMGVSGDQGAGNVSYTEGEISGDHRSVSPLMEWFGLIDSGETEAAGVYLLGKSESESTSEWIITQNDDIMQNNSSNNVEISVNEYLPENLSTPETPDYAVSPDNADDFTQIAASDFGSQSPDSITNTDASKPAFAQTDAFYDITAADRTTAEHSSLETRAPAMPIETVSKAVAELLAELPEFQSTPPQALERFSLSLLRTSRESAEASNGDVGKLIALLEEMFTRIEKNDKDSGTRLKSAKEELYARLVLAEEAISRAAPHTKTEMLEQTRRLMDHVRVLNNIEQFAYFQLPVQINDERRTAELYVFKKKGGKRVDPENANILLSLDLENMGHWEGLINFRGKDVSIRMEVRGLQEKEFISENTVLLHELLAEVGFKLVNTDISLSVKETTPIEALSVFERFSTSRAGSVDYIV